MKYLGKFILKPPFMIGWAGIWFMGSIACLAQQDSQPFETRPAKTGELVQAYGDNKPARSAILGADRAIDVFTKAGSVEDLKQVTCPRKSPPFEAGVLS